MSRPPPFTRLFSSSSWSAAKLQPPRAGSNPPPRDAILMARELLCYYPIELGLIRIIELVDVAGEGH